MSWHEGPGDAALVGAQIRGRVRRLGYVGVVVVALALELVFWGFDTHSRVGQQLPRPVVVAGIVLVFAVLVWRRRHPIAAFGVAWIYSLGFGVLLPSFQPFTALVLALYTAARQAGPQRGICLLAAALVLVPVHTLDTATATGERPVEVAVTAAVWVVVFGATWALARAGWGVERRTEQAFAALTAQATVAAQTERLRIARDVHDVVAHSVTAMILHAAARRSPDSDRESLQATLALVESVGVQAMGELRTLLTLLHTDINTDGYVGAVNRGIGDVGGLVATTRACGVDVRVVRRGDPGVLPSPIDEAGYRIVQELLTNVAKHGGDRPHARLTIWWHDGHLELTLVNTVSPRGARWVPTPSGFGLAGIQRRVDELGGSVTISRPTARRFCCQVMLPMARQGNQQTRYDSGDCGRRGRGRSAEFSPSGHIGRSGSSGQLGDTHIASEERSGEGE